MTTKLLIRNFLKMLSWGNLFILHTIAQRIIGVPKYLTQPKFA